MWLRTTCNLEFQMGDVTPLILMLRPRSGHQQWVARETYTLSPSVAVEEYTDIFGNLCQRLMVPAGVFSVRTSADVMTADVVDKAPGAFFVEIQNLPDAVLSRLDVVIGAVHSRFELSRAKQTRRILRAMDNPNFTLLAHPSGRLIDRREPYAVDMARIIRHARERGCFLELNAHPERLDLLDTHCQLAREEGVLVSINSDAHSGADFDNLRFGVGQARRGRLEKGDVLNTRPLTALRKLLATTR